MATSKEKKKQPGFISSCVILITCIHFTVTLYLRVISINLHDTYINLSTNINLNTAETFFLNFDFN